MPEQYGFGDYATEATRLCQSNKGGDQMNQKDDEVAHCANRTLALPVVPNPVLF
jgi:hypothetical protein